MAIEHIKMRRIARELQEWVFLGIEDGMVRSAQDYMRLMAEGRVPTLRVSIFAGWIAAFDACGTGGHSENLYPSF